MRANRTRTWTTVSSPCRQAVEEAYHAYRETGGLFDPRILAALKQIGYDRSFAYGAAPEVTPQPQGDPAAVAPFGHPWLPEFDEARSEIAIGEIPIDLGGIGKGLALRWAAARLAGCCPWFLIEAGGDCSLGGPSPTGGGWSVGVEDPEGGQTPAAVLAITDAACATTSTRLRRWRAGSVQVHHILDPRTGWPAESGLLSVTVVDADPATAEVWSKSLLIAGPDHIASLASSKELAALWIDERGRIEASPQMTEFIRWQR
jgi:thiamine biosynthesis lipoprotein